MSVFVSSTCYDLLDLRAELELFFRDSGVSARFSDRTTSDFEVEPDKNSIETCLSNVRACEEFLIVLSQRYGPSLARAGYQDVSATHLEYLEAVKHQKPVRMYVRDRLDADYTLWKQNSRSDQLTFAWCKDAKDHGLFRLLDQHTKLVADETRSNWVTLFCDSLDVKQQIARDYAGAFARATVELLFKTGRIPFLEITGAVAQYGTGSVVFSLTVRNFGTVPAISPRLTFEPDSKEQILRSLGPGETADCRIEWGNHFNAPLSLPSQLTYSTVEGHQFVNHGEIKVAFRQADKPDTVTYTLKKRAHIGFSDKVFPRPGAPASSLP